MIKVEDKDLGFDVLAKSMEELVTLEVRAGVIGDEAVLEYAPGVEARTGFMRDSIDANSDRISSAAESAIGEMVDQDKTAREALQFVADDAGDIIIEGIEDRDLISTGAMRDSIIGEVQDATR